jgi:CRISPR-associated helicase Cas3
MFCVREYRLPIVQHRESASPLYPHQVAVWEGWDKNQTTLLTAKTGTGKTRAVVWPLLKRQESAVMVYPTNELLRDQVRAIGQFAKAEGINTAVLAPEKDGGDEQLKCSSADHLIVPVNAALLDEWQKSTHCRNRGEALRRILEPNKPKIVLTNPDVLFLILGLHYHAEPLEALRRYQTLALDEFHLYTGVEFAHALAMIGLARGLGTFRRVLLLSATPDPEARDVLARVLEPVRIDSDSIAAGDQAPARTAVHSVQMTPIQAGGPDPTEAIVREVMRLKAELDQLRAQSTDAGYVPAVVIVNSVVNAIRLEDRLVESGFLRESLAVVRGLSNRAIRTINGKVLAIGTSAVEVGVDFHCDYLIFEAYDAASFLQRFGRVGRHKPGRAIVLVPPNAFEGMAKIGADIDRGSFEACVHRWYPASSSRSWFASTEYGMITACALGQNLIATVARDRHASAEVLRMLRERIDSVYSDHARKLGCPELYERAKGTFGRAMSGKRHSRWVRTYCQLNRFRTSLPSVRIHDFAEQHRRAEWQMGEYEADLATLLKRAVGISWNSKLQILTIKGIGRYRRVHASEIFEDNDCGAVLETQDYPQLRLYQDGESTPVSEIMSGAGHIFAVVPKAEVTDEIDWRVPVFETGGYLLAFDGAALLLLEAARRVGQPAS